jgi:type IV secretory pathway TrbF-like protein
MDFRSMDRDFTLRDYDDREMHAGWCSAYATIQERGLAFAQDYLNSKEPFYTVATEPALKSYWFGYAAHIAYHIWH